MELTQENIEELAKQLKINGLNKAMEELQDYFKIAEDLIKQYPGLTIEEIAKKFDAQNREKDNNEELDMR